MLTEKDIKEQYGDNITFLFKPHLEENGETVFTQSDNGKPMGALIEKDGKVQCYECGKWFKHLGQHIRGNHKFSATDYKKKYGFSESAGLCSKEISRKISKRVIDLGLNKKIGDIGRNALNKFRYKSGRLANKSIQKKNAINTCPAQYEARFRLIFAKLGKDAKSSDAYLLDSSAYRFFEKKYGSFNKAKEHFGFTIFRQSQNSIDNSEYIYSLRDYVRTYKSLPWSQKRYKNFERLNGFLIPKNNYAHRFGSFRKAWLHCGIRQVKRGVWEIID